MYKKFFTSLGIYTVLVFLILSPKASWASVEDFRNPGAPLSLANVTFVAENPPTSVTGENEYYTAFAGDVDGDGLSDVLIGEPAFGYEGGTGRVYLVLGRTIVNSGGTVYLSNADYKITYNGTHQILWSVVGVSIASAGDVDGDGLSDILIGKPFIDRGPPYAPGGVYLILGRSLPNLGPQIYLSNADYIYSGNVYIETDPMRAFGDGTGDSLASAGDVDGDGKSDVLIGAPYYRDGDSNAGRAYLILGSSLGQPGTGIKTLDNASDYIYAGEPGSSVGFSVSSAGDFDGDGLDDILIGDPNFIAFLADNYNGVCYLLVASNLGEPGINYFSDDFPGRLDYTNSSISFRIPGFPGDHLGTIVKGVGDVNGDGFDDFLYHSPGRDPEVSDIYLRNPTLRWPYLVAEAGHQVNNISAGDVNDDGLSDILMNENYCEETDGPNGGGRHCSSKARLFSGERLRDAYYVHVSTADFIIQGGDEGTRWIDDGSRVQYYGSDFITSAAADGDVNGDGKADILIGVRNTLTPNGNAAYLIYSACRLTLSPTTLVNGYVGETYTYSPHHRYRIIARGGSGPYSFSIATGGLPPGLSLSSDGLLTGVPREGGTYHFIISARDRHGCVGNQVYQIIIRPGRMSILPTYLPKGKRGRAYFQALSVKGGKAPYAYIISEGALPTGLTLSSTGRLSGTPRQSGQFSFTVKARDRYNSIATRRYTLLIFS